MPTGPAGAPNGLVTGGADAGSPIRRGDGAMTDDDGTAQGAGTPVATGGLLDRRRFGQLLLLGLRLANAAAKFALALHMVRHLGLADVGIYGLLVGAGTAVPGIFGFGVNDWTARRLVGMPRARAIPIVVTRFALSAAIQVVLQAIGWSLWAAGMVDLPLSTALLIAAILLLEHLAVDDYYLEIARERATFANLQLFLRAGAWPPVVIVWGWIDPAARSLDVVLAGWLTGLVVMWVAVAVRGLGGGRRHHLGLDFDHLVRALRGGVPFWIADVGGSGTLYLDRFIVSGFLGLETTGVYTFFWSFANVVHTLSVNGIVQPQVPRLIAAERGGDPRAFVAERDRLVRESAGWAAILAFGAGVALPILLPWFGRPQLSENLVIFWVILAATAARIGYDGLGFVLYALHRDRTIATTALAAVVATGAVDVVMVPTFGLPGAAAAYLLVGVGLFLVRRRLVAAEIDRRTVAAEAAQ